MMDVVQSLTDRLNAEHDREQEAARAAREQAETTFWTMAEQLASGAVDEHSQELDTLSAALQTLSLTPAALETAGHQLRELTETWAVFGDEAAAARATADQAAIDAANARCAKAKAKAEAAGLEVRQLANARSQYQQDLRDGRKTIRDLAETLEASGYAGAVVPDTLRKQIADSKPAPEAPGLTVAQLRARQANEQLAEINEAARQHQARESQQRDFETQMAAAKGWQMPPRSREFDPFDGESRR